MDSEWKEDKGGKNCLIEQIMSSSVGVPKGGNILGGLWMGSQSTRVRFQGDRSQFEGMRSTQSLCSNCGKILQKKKQLMVRVVELVPRHPGRTKKQEPAATSNDVPTKSSKGGKKKR
ncbi:hypothetical protein OSB04_022282 [Centaurea solstitialis]|uniref:Uncharacterized protein n=1 Tax=Centaurea solstitialis TaxID=347529 RepID=A0AA38WH33_9ASTR|nr:hypothetical protein OSB04_022282 [Centaurea solstitialis]